MPYRFLIYCDESGEASFSLTSAYRYFSVCAMTVDKDNLHKIKNTIKRKRAKLYRLGWPKNVEIKASALHNIKRNKYIPTQVKKRVDGDSFIKEILKSFKYACAPRIDYIVVNKDRLTDKSFRNAPYGIAYNFFAGKILIPLVLKYKNCLLTVDRRNKEMHPRKHFDGYIETRSYGVALEKGISIDLKIIHDESRSNYGLQAVDFFSWAIYRKITHKDYRFFDVFEDLIVEKQEWYCS